MCLGLGVEVGLWEGSVLTPPISPQGHAGRELGPESNFLRKSSNLWPAGETRRPGDWTERLGKGALQPIGRKLNIAHRDADVKHERGKIPGGSLGRANKGGDRVKDGITPPPPRFYVTKWSGSILYLGTFYGLLVETTPMLKWESLATSWWAKSRKCGISSWGLMWPGSWMPLLWQWGPHQGVGGPVFTILAQWWGNQYGQNIMPPTESRITLHGVEGCWLCHPQASQV